MLQPRVWGVPEFGGLILNLGALPALGGLFLNLGCCSCTVLTTYRTFMDRQNLPGRAAGLRFLFSISYTGLGTGQETFSAQGNPKNLKHGDLTDPRNLKHPGTDPKNLKYRNLTDPRNLKPTGISQIP